MQWSELFSDGHAPLNSQIKDFVATPLWDDLANHLQQTYNVEPKLFYSGCLCLSIKKCSVWRPKSAAPASTPTDLKYFVCER